MTQMRRLLLIQAALWISLLPLPALSQSFRLSEFMARNESAWRTPAGGDYCDWIEIENTGKNAASLAGWYLTDDSGKPRKWQFPDVEIAGDGFLVVTADDDPAKGALDTTFSLDASGEYLALVSPDGTIVDEIAPSFPPQLPDISWARTGQEGTPWEYASPTPSLSNSESLQQVPLRIWDLTENPEIPVADAPIPVSVRVDSVRPGQTVASVVLYYRINFDTERSISMKLDAPADAPPSSYVAEIPAQDFGAGDMIRWRVEATASTGETSKQPPFKRSRDSAEYHGTVSIDPDTATELPVLHWFVERPARADTRSGTQASVFYKGRFYDNIFCRTRGQSTANWEKPKYKFDFHKGQHFFVSDELPKVEEFNLNSFLRGHTREPAMFTYLTDAGANAPHTFYIQVNQNGDYHGLFGYVEQIDKRFLRRIGFDATGPLYKAAQVPATMALNPSASLYEKHLKEDEPYTDLRELASGINVRNEERFAYFADHVNVPNYINVMAAMMVPFNHDQLTKNYYLYRDPNREEWFRFPWDADQAFPTGRANTNENWTSPLYGDKDHTQELLNNRPNPIWQNHLHANVLDNPVTREMYLRRVRTLMDTYLAQELPKPQIVLLSGEKGVTVAHYRVPVDDSEDQTWYSKDFDHSDWSQGPLGFGFELLGQEYESLIGTRVRPFETSPQSTSIYLRIPFTVDEPSAIDHWTLRMKYDDGFVAYLNGTEVARANIADQPRWSTKASSHPDSEALEYEEFPLNSFSSLLVPGENILAIQIANVSAPSSDLLVVPEIVSGNPQPSGYFERLFESIETEIAAAAETDRLHWRDKGVNIPRLESDIRSAIGSNSSLERRRTQLFEQYATGPDRLIPDSQPVNAKLEFGRIDRDPAEGGQDAEFLEIINPNSFAVDLSGWKLYGGVRFPFPHGTVIASNRFAEEGMNRLYLSPNVATFRQRPDFPLSGGSRFVIGNYSGHLSNFSETVRLVDSTGHPAASLTTPALPNDLQANLRITEIMYHPSDTKEDTEFIELTNLSDSLWLELAGVSFTQGIQFTFEPLQLAPGASILIVENPTAFEESYGSVVAEHVIGAFEDGTGLSNGGEPLKLEDARGNTIAELTYNDKHPWPQAADGEGASLASVSPGDPDDAQTWQASALSGGSPGIFEPRSFAGNPDADQDHDGFSALLEFAIGTSDSVASQAETALTLTMTDRDSPTVSIRRNLEAYVRFEIEISQDMLTWSDAKEHLVFERREAVAESNSEWWYYSLNYPGNSSTYIRLKVTQ